jgi:hypothetical protein
MKYPRYSKEALDALPPHSQDLKRRIVELRVDVQLELHATVAAKFREIVAQLNSHGHDLREENRSKPGEIGYAEGERPNPFYLCCDTTISAGYAQTDCCETPPENEEEWSKQGAMAERWEEEWLQRRALGALPNGGPEEQLGNSNVNGGPPSVS